MSKSKNYQKFLSATIAVATVASSTVIPYSVLNVEAGAPSFSDIVKGTYYYDAVIDLVGKGVIQGFEDGTFKPYQATTRGQASAMIARALDLDEKKVTDPGFSDVSKNNRFYHSIAALVESGIVDGVTEDSFQPNRLVTRAEMAKMITNAFGLKQNKDHSALFTDVPNNSWYAGFVKALYDNGVTIGKTETTFAPSENVHRGQLATFIYRAQQNSKSTSVIENVTDSAITIDGESYIVSENFQKLFNSRNAAVLKNANIDFEEKDGVITSVKNLEITESGKATVSGQDELSGHLLLDGQGAIIDGNVIINSDYVTVKNLTVKGNFTVGTGVQNSFFTDKLVVEGKTIISDDQAETLKAASNKFYKSLKQKVSAASMKMAAETKKVKIIFSNSTLKVVEVSKDDVNFESTGTTTLLEVTLSSNASITADRTVEIPKITLQIGAKEVEINATVKNLTIDSSEAITLTGNATLENVKIEQDVKVNLNTTGEIKQIESTNKDAKIIVKEGTKVGNVVVPKGSKANEIIQNYDAVKGDIGQIGGTKNPDATPVTSPTTGNSGSSDGGNTGSSDQTAEIVSSFKTTHATTLALTVETIGISNKAIVQDALSAYNNSLSPTAKSSLTLEKSLLDSLIVKIGELESEQIVANLQAAKIAAAGKQETDYTEATWSILQTALGLAEGTDQEKISKTTAINSAVAGLVQDQPEPTDPEEDKTPPIFDMPNFGVVDKSDSSVNLNVKVNENGTGYYVLYPFSEDVASPSQVKKGQDGLGNPAFKHGSFPLSKDEQATITISGLDAGTKYNLVMFVEDEAGNATNLHVFRPTTLNGQSAETPSAPAVTADDENNDIIGLDETMEFSIDGSDYVKFDGTNAPELSGNKTVLVRVAAVEEGSSASEDTELIFTENIYENYVAATEEELIQAIESTNITDITLENNITLTEELKVTRKVDFDLNGKNITGDIRFETSDNGNLTFENGTLNGKLSVNTPNISFINGTVVTGDTTIENVANATFTNAGTLADVEIVDNNGARFINNQSSEDVGEVTVNTEQPVTLGGDLKKVTIEQSTSVIVESGTIDEVVVTDESLEIEISILEEVQAQVLTRPNSVSFKPITTTDLDNIVDARVKLEEFEAIIQTDLSNSANLEKAHELNRLTIEAIVKLPDGIESRRLFDRYHTSKEILRQAQITPEDVQAVEDAINSINLTVKNPTSPTAEIELPQFSYDETGLDVSWTNYDEEPWTESTYVTPERPKDGLTRTVILRVDVNHGAANEHKLFAITIPSVDSEIMINEVESSTRTDYVTSDLFTFSDETSYEIKFKQGATVGNLVESGLFGSDEVRVVSYLKPTKALQSGQIMKVDTSHSSSAYSIQLDEDLEKGEGIEGEGSNLFTVDHSNRVISYKGLVTVEEVRAYLIEQNPFDDNFLVISFYQIEPEDSVLLSGVMSVLVGSNEQHAMYSLSEDVDPRAPKFRAGFSGFEDKYVSEDIKRLGIPVYNKFVGENLKYDISAEPENAIDIEVDEDGYVHFNTLFNLEEIEEFSLQDIKITVTAENEYGKLTDTFTISFYPAVSELKSYKVENGNKIQWKESRVKEVTGYQVFRSTDTNFENGEPISVVNKGTNFYIDKDIQADDDYFYFVRPIMDGKVVESSEKEYTNVKEVIKDRLEITLKNLSGYNDMYYVVGLYEEVMNAEFFIAQAIKSGWTEAEIKEFSGYENYSLAKNKLESISVLNSPSNLSSDGTRISWNQVESATAAYAVQFYQKDKDAFGNEERLKTSLISKNFIDLSSVEDLEPGEYHIKVFSMEHMDAGHKISKPSELDIIINDESSVSGTEIDEEVTSAATLNMNETFVLENGKIKFIS